MGHTPAFLPRQSQRLFIFAEHHILSALQAVADGRELGRIGRLTTLWLNRLKLLPAARAGHLERTLDFHLNSPQATFKYSFIGIYIGKSP
jgi:hypothetical protein